MLIHTSTPNKFCHKLVALHLWRHNSHLLSRCFRLSIPYVDSFLYPVCAIWNLYIGGLSLWFCNSHNVSALGKATGSCHLEGLHICRLNYMPYVVSLYTIKCIHLSYIDTPKEIRKGNKVKQER